MFNNDSGHVYISHDGRESSSIENDLISEYHIKDHLYALGPISYTSSKQYESNEKTNTCAIQITASHNQYHDNGLKFFDHRGTKLMILFSAR